MPKPFNLPVLFQNIFYKLILHHHLNAAQFPNECIHFHVQKPDLKQHSLPVRPTLLSSPRKNLSPGEKSVSSAVSSLLERI